MRAVLPGRPEARLQALSTGFWECRRIIVYITGNAFAILTDHNSLLQTICDDDDDEPLQAVAFDEVSGKIAACTEREVRIYRPYGLGDGTFKWSLRHTLSLNDTNGEQDDTPTTALTLSWGSDGELLIGRSALALYHTDEESDCIWSQKLPSPVKSAHLSFDSAYIACFGYADRLVKLWRRLSYTDDEVCFDLQYLRHPRTVLSTQWRRPRHIEQSVDNALYTFCEDKVVRIWTGSESHGGSHLRLWGQVELSVTAPGTSFAASLVVLLQGRDFSAAVESAVTETSMLSQETDTSTDYAVQVANQSPEVVLAWDDNGKMRAWAIENVSCKTQASSNTFLVADIAAKEFNALQQDLRDTSIHVNIHAYCNDAGGPLTFLFHVVDGRIEFYTSNIARLLDAKPPVKRLEHKGTWCGHSAPIANMVRNHGGQALLSRTTNGEAVMWKHIVNTGSMRLQRCSVFPHREQILRVCVLRKGRFVSFLHHDRLDLWDCRGTNPHLLASHPVDLPGSPLCLIILPREDATNASKAHLGTVTTENSGQIWEVMLPKYSGVKQGEMVNEHQQASIRDFGQFEWNDAGNLAYVLPVDPAGSSPVQSGFLDIFARDVAISLTHGGRLEFWTARNENSRIDWKPTCSLETHVSNPALVSGSTSKTAALVDSTRTTLTIWDVASGRLEYDEDFGGQSVIQDLDWTATPDSQSILAVGFSYRVLLLSQQRFDYLNRVPAWAPIRDIDIREFTPHPIGDSTWLKGGSLVVGAGQQLFVYDRLFDSSDSLITSLDLPDRKHGKWDLFEAVQRLNGPLPVYHPQFVSQYLLAGHFGVVNAVLLALHRTLKYHVEGETFDPYLGLDIDMFYRPSESAGSIARHRIAGIANNAAEEDEDEDEDNTFDEHVAQVINEKLTTVSLSGLSGHDQIEFADMVECAAFVQKHRQSIDENGARFMLFYRQKALRRRRVKEVYTSWRDINWAYHSTSQDILADFVSRQHQSRVTWEDARESGVCMWLSDVAAVRAQFEVIARNEYTKSELKDPIECSLFYLALRKKTVLYGLWRMASWNKEQAATQKFLANNFNEPKWKSAALKNAYALLSKRRFAYSASFFLLADRLQDAVNVCLQQLKDLQLAIAITRVYEGDDGPVLSKLLEEEVLPLAAREGNRWLASWTFWMLHRRDMAVHALVAPVYTLVETPHAPDIQSKSFLADDPALTVLYSQLRQKSLQTTRGASGITVGQEGDFVLYNAKLYSRMGCDLLGLSLLRNWEFIHTTDDVDTQTEIKTDPRDVEDGQPSHVVHDVSTTNKQGSNGTGFLDKKHQPLPAVFKEPDASSLLDSFGF